MHVSSTWPCMYDQQWLPCSWCCLVGCMLWFTQEQHVMLCMQHSCAVSRACKHAMVRLSGHLAIYQDLVMQHQGYNRRIWSCRAQPLAILSNGLQPGKPMEASMHASCQVWQKPCCMLPDAMPPIPSCLPACIMHLDWHAISTHAHAADASPIARISSSSGAPGSSVSTASYSHLP